MNVIRDPGREPARDRPLLVMLPGAGDRALDFVERGFVRELRSRGIAAEALAVDAHSDYYVEATVVARLHEEVLAPAGGGRPVWMMGISLGGLGALAYAREHPGTIKGVVLLAPFLGTRGLIAEVMRAGGLRAWQPGAIAPEDGERRLLAWLRGYRAGDPAWPRIHLGYGTEDRYAQASEMLAELLPASCVIAAPGGHDWDTWLALWGRLLDQGVLKNELQSTTDEHG
jgi:pimeloyl-ACP methyl ester carboxylesterase